MHAVRGTDADGRSGALDETVEAPSSQLDETDLAVLAFERDFTGSAAAKEEAIATRLGLSPARYQQRLTTLIRRPEAVRYDPMLVSRLLRLETARAAERQRRASAIAAGSVRGAALR